MPIQKITSGIIQDGAVSAADIVSVSNTAITGNIISSQITSVANTQLTGLIQAAQIGSANATLITSGTLPGARLPAGSVLQVVQTVTNSTYSVNTTSATASGFIGTITPTSSSSKILVSINGGQFRYSPSAGQETHVRMYRSIGGGAYSIISAIGDLTEILISPANSVLAIPHSFSYLDSPATTSSVSYQPYINSNSGPITTYFNLASVYVTMTLMEIAA
jgi:hypothetical protein